MQNDRLFLRCGLPVLVIICILSATSSGSAHPMGNFSISHYTSIRVERDFVDLRYIIDIAEIPTFQEIQDKGIAPQTQGPALDGYLAKKAEALKQDLFLYINGHRLEMRAGSSEVIFPPGAGGLPTMKIGIEYEARFDGLLQDGMNRLEYHDANFPGRAGWKEIIASGSQGVTLVDVSVPDKDRSLQLTDYPTDLLNSPPQVLEAHLVFAVKEDSQRMAASAKGGTAAPANFEPAPLQANRQATPRSRFTELVASKQLSFRVVVLALLVALCLGALHALEPGHGKTIVAAYLVGSRGTASNAVLLGLIVTASHTAGVYLIGLVTLYASRYVVAERLYPWLGVISGLIIAAFGTFLIFDRYALRGRSHAHVHSHGHSHTYGPGLEIHHAAMDDHGEHPHPHHHGPHTHQHHHESDGPVSFGRLLTLGVTGGIVPCPAALVVLLSAVALHRIGFGLLLIGAFSLGLAAVLIIIGLVMVQARRTLSRFSGDTPLVTRWLPLTSAALITLFGLAMMIQALFTI